MDTDRKDWRIIGKDHCPWCVKAKDLLLTVGETFVYLNLSHNNVAQEIMKLVGFTTVPQIYNERGELIGGYDDLVRYLNLPKQAANTPI